MIYKRTFLLTGIVLIIIVLLCSCQLISNIDSLVNIDQVNNSPSSVKLQSMTDSGPISGGILNVYVDNIDNFNPLFTENQLLAEHYTLIFDELFEIDHEGLLKSELAEEWEISEDGLVLSIKIKDNLRWHDGHSLTADDVEFTLDTIKNNDVNSVYSDRLININAYAVHDDRTIVLILKESDPFVLYKLDFPIIPRHYYRNCVPGQESSVAPGTGLFVAERFSTDLGLVLNRFTKVQQFTNSNLVGLDELNDGIATIVIRIVKDKSPLEALLIKDVDVVKLKSNKIAGYKNRTDISVYEYPGHDIEMLICNNKDVILESSYVRKAISLFLDRDSIIDEVYKGKAVKAEIPLNCHLWITNHVNVIEKNEYRAKELLEEDGWVVENGYYTKRINGVKRQLSLEMIINTENTERRQLAEIVKKNLDEVGIEVTITDVPWPEVYDNMSKRDYQMILTGYEIPIVPSLYPLYMSNNYGDKIADISNISGYKNSQIDELAGSISRNLSFSKQRLVMGQIIDIIENDVPYIGICIKNEALLASRKIRGTIDPYYLDMYNCIDNWYLID